MKIISCCGNNCLSCEHYDVDCKGCDESLGQIYWAKYSGIGICPIYNCCRNEKEYPHCGLCKDLACEKFSDLRDPKMSEIEHVQSIIDRISLLKEL